MDLTSIEMRSAYHHFCVSCSFKVPNTSAFAWELDPWHYSIMKSDLARWLDLSATHGHHGQRHVEKFARLVPYLQTEHATRVFYNFMTQLHLIRLFSHTSTFWKHFHVVFSQAKDYLRNIYNISTTPPNIQAQLTCYIPFAHTCTSS